MTPQASLLTTLAVSPTATPAHGAPSTSSFSSQSLWLPCGARGVFGGQVIGQSLAAASRTVSSLLGLHSLHCYFLSPADAAVPIIYEVERLRDGKSYATRLVRAWQSDKVVFILIASFAQPPVALPEMKGADEIPFSYVATTRERPVSRSLRFAKTPSSASDDRKCGTEAARKLSEAVGVAPRFEARFQIDLKDEVVPWEESEEEEFRWDRFLGSTADLVKGRMRTAVEEYIQERRESPVGIAVAKRSNRGSDKDDERNRRMIWLKARLSPGETLDTETTKIMIAYMTDYQFIGTASRAVGLTRTSSPRLGMLASLDHSMHFYPFPAGFDPARPILHVMEVAVTDVSSGRGVVRGQLYDEKGRLLAVTQQEGVVRADLGGGKKEKGLVEGGGVEEAEEERRDRAKL